MFRKCGTLWPELAWGISLLAVPSQKDDAHLSEPSVSTPTVFVWEYLFVINLISDLPNDYMKLSLP